MFSVWSTAVRGATTSCLRRGAQIKLGDGYAHLYRESRLLTTSAHEGVAQVGRLEPRPFQDIPGPRGAPLLGTWPRAVLYYMFRRNKIENELYNHLQRRYEKYGPIYRTSDKHPAVWLFDISQIQEVLRTEGKYPNRGGHRAWELHRKIRGLPGGLLAGHGPDWQRYRSTVNKPLLRPNLVALHCSRLDIVAQDFIQHLRNIRTQDGVIPDVHKELVKWSVEGAGMFLFNHKLNLFGDVISDRAKVFIQSFFDVAETTYLLEPLKLHYYLNTSTWRRHKRGWDVSFSVAKELTEEQLKILKEKGSDADAQTSIFAHLLQREEELSPDEFLCVMMDLASAAVDTSATVMMFSLYILARNPHIQQKLHAEVMGVVKDREHPITNEDMNRMPYLKGLVKEALRLYPVLSINGRILEKEAVLCGYRVPAKTLVQIAVNVMGRDPANFEDPEEVKPERWFRENRQHAHVFSGLPFGFGPRMCIGKRLAELEIYLLLAKISQTFHVEQERDEVLKPVIQLALAMNKPVSIRLLER